MIMFAMSSPLSPSTPDSGFSSPSCSYFTGTPVTNETDTPKSRRSSQAKFSGSSRRIRYVVDVATQTDTIDPTLRKIAYRLADLCDDFDREFFSSSTFSSSSVEDSSLCSEVSSFAERIWSWLI